MTSAILPTPPRVENLVQLFGRSVHMYADETAVRDEVTAMTYVEVDRAADRVADALVSLGVVAGDRVAFLLRRGVTVIPAVLGILKAAAAYVPLDPRLPKARRDHMLSQIEATVVLTESDWVDDLSPVSALAIDDAIARTPSSSARPVVSSMHTACVLFTSGSSGTPKATVIEHRNLVAFACNPALPRLVSADRVGQISSVSFDAFHYEVWCALAVGASVVVLPTAPDLVAQGTRDRLSAEGVTAMLVPTMAVNYLLADDREALAGLRVLCTGGDVLSPQACRDLLASSFEGTFVNLYGPTEATTACTAFTVDAIPTGPVPIGRPLSGATVTIVDESLREVPAGERGEICIGGHGVAGGYLGSPADTADRFRPDPRGEPGARVYRTGDLGHVRPDGHLAFDGRADRQAKIRGYRVDFGEVELALGEHSEVTDVAVTSTGESHDRAIVAFAAGTENLTPEKLVRFAQDSLPHYMVPVSIHILPHLPMTRHGKRDWAQLVAYGEAAVARESAAAPPQGWVETAIAETWAALLQVDTIGREDNFFSLGGNSLLAFRAQVGLRRSHGLTFDLRVFLAQPTLKALARNVRKAP